MTKMSSSERGGEDKTMKEQRNIRAKLYGLDEDDGEGRGPNPRGLAMFEGAGSTTSKDAAKKVLRQINETET